MKIFKTKPRDYIITLFVWILVTFTSFFIIPFIGYRAVGYLYLFSVIAIGFRSAFGPIILSTFLSALAWNFFFITPYFTLHINDIEDQMMFLAFLFVGLLSGIMARQLRQREMLVLKRERNTRILFHLLKNFSKAVSIEEIAQLTNDSFLELFNFKSQFFLSKEAGVLEDSPVLNLDFSYHDFSLAKYSFKNNKRAGWGTGIFIESKCLSIPLGTADSPIGALIIYPQDFKIRLSISEEILLDNIILLINSTIEQLQSTNKKHEIELLKNSEMLHQTLLNSISHEMRIPITTIMGNISALADPTIFADDQKRLLLNNDIIESCNRLNQVVENLLDMNRLESGLLSLTKEWIDIEELIGNVIIHFQSSNDLFNIIIQTTPCLLFCDVKLMEHALFNLVSNAIKYSPTQAKIDIEVTMNSGLISIYIKDLGPGIPKDELELIFQKFYRIKGRSQSGIGLGLSIVKGIIEVHGGKVIAINRESGIGAQFELQLPFNKSELKNLEA